MDLKIKKWIVSQNGWYMINVDKIINFEIEDDDGFDILVTLDGSDESIVIGDFETENEALNEMNNIRRFLILNISDTYQVLSPR